jgi:hypothetical protein
MYALKSSEARRQYPKRLKMLFDYHNLQGSLQEQAKHFLDNTRLKSIHWAQDSIMIFLDFHKERVRKKELAAGTLKNYYRAAKLFCEMNDLTLNWKRISKGLPKAKNASNDRAPTIEEIRKLVEYPDRRIKPIVYAMASGGFRLGGWDYLQWKHVFPINNENAKDGEVIAVLSQVSDMKEPRQIKKLSIFLLQ